MPGHASDQPSPLDRAHKAVERIFTKIDWDALGDVYCDEGGEAFWVVRRGPARRAGLEWGRAAARRLARGGTSLWVGAGVAEIGPMVFEALALGRTVRATNLRTVECEILMAAFEASGVGDALSIRPIDAAGAVAEGPYDHLGMVSVLTDPERFPQLSGVGYGRLHPVFVDAEAFVAERETARELTRACLGGLEVPGLVTTSFEEVAWVLEWAQAQGGLEVEAGDEEIESAVVGDAIGFLDVRRARMDGETGEAGGTAP